jgi:hypothetical protein
MLTSLRRRRRSRGPAAATSPDADGLARPLILSVDRCHGRGLGVERPFGRSGGRQAAAARLYCAHDCWLWRGNGTLPYPNRGVNLPEPGSGAWPQPIGLRRRPVQRGVISFVNPALRRAFRPIASRPATGVVDQMLRQHLDIVWSEDAARSQHITRFKPAGNFSIPIGLFCEGAHPLRTRSSSC